MYTYLKHALTQYMDLLPAGSEGHEVLRNGSIHVAILHSCQFRYNSAFSVH